ncbi:hypothetical protein LMG26411_02294 [Cupriavidus numazuensis]|uniref:Uncharacterized protein n=1 Tax=Cupriavidus numazuensis TaxID=221992 RepID=A0ABN7PW14_9BURK|nr:hypothetical protein LMG26411_02294 [Cupriavidus numazuensis]
MFARAHEQHWRQALLDFVHPLHDLLQPRTHSRPDRDAKFVEQPTQLVDQHGAYLDAQLTQGVQPEHALLGLGLRGHHRHVRLLCRRPDRLRIGRIRLVPLHERTHIAGMQQHRLMPQRSQLTGPPVCAATRLEHHAARLTPRQELDQFRATEAPVETLPRRLNPIELEDSLCNVQAISRSIHLGSLHPRGCRHFHFGTSMPFCDGGPAYSLTFPRSTTELPVPSA